MSQATSSYYLWKWADNDLPGPPNEVFSELLRGSMHPAIQPFDGRPILRDFRATAEKRHALGEDWDWQIQPNDDAAHTKFIVIQCPAIPLYGALRQVFSKLVYTQDLSGYDEQRGNLIWCLLPKLNSIAFGENLDEELCDIGADDLSVLLGRLSPKQDYPWARLVNRASNWAECYAHHNGFAIEWLENHSLTDDTDHDHWRAGYGNHQTDKHRIQSVCEQRVINSELCTVAIQEFPHEKLRFGDVLRIFQAFLRGEPKPSRYHWRSLRQEFEQAEQQQKAASHE
jgi:hypothetical protein